MYLTSDEETIFRLDILRYEAPGARTDFYSANWLVARLQVDTRYSSWSATGTSLLTTELLRLKDWCEMLRKGETPTSSVGFIEAGLYISATDNALEVRLRHTFESDWYKPEHTDEQFTLVFPLTTHNLDGCIARLEKLINDYPVVNVGK